MDQAMDKAIQGTAAGILVSAEVLVKNILLRTTAMGLQDLILGCSIPMLPMAIEMVFVRESRIASFFARFPKRVFKGHLEMTPHTTIHHEALVRSLGNRSISPCTLHRINRTTS